MEYTKLVACVNQALKLVGIDTSVCVDSDMARAIQEWCAIYEGKPSWLSSADGIKTANVGGAVSAELARLTTLEMQASVSDEMLDAVLQGCIEGLRTKIEFGCALGSMAIKPNYNKATGLMAVQYIRADAFVPISFDDGGNITQCAFIEQMRKGKMIYTRLELHRVYGDKLTIENHAYLSTTGVNFGTPLAIADIPEWADFADIAEFNTNKIPVGLFRVPLANTVSSESPLGVSVFSRAIDLLEEADRRYSNECWELESKQTAVHIASALLKLNQDTKQYEYPQNRQRLYRALDYSVGVTDKPMLDVFSPEIRIDAMKQAYQAQLQRIEFACGLSYGVISDLSIVEKTATEIKSGKQRLYATVTDLQKALETALRDFVDAIAFWLGKTNYTVSFVWDDSIITDSNELRIAKMLEFNSGLIDAVQFYMDVWGLDEEAAIEFDRKIKERSPAPASIDFFGGGE